MSISDLFFDMDALFSLVQQDPCGSLYSFYIRNICKNSNNQIWYHPFLFSINLNMIFYY